LRGQFVFDHLEDAVLVDRFRQFLERLRVQKLPGLIRVGKQISLLHCLPESNLFIGKIIGGERRGCIYIPAGQMGMSREDFLDGHAAKVIIQLFIAGV
jgi:hypothetical protein